MSVASIKTKLPTIKDVCSSGTNLASCIKTFGDKGSSISNIYHHDGILENGINDNSYRFAGASDAVNNYVCFGSTTTPCPEDNLYRIIGVFDGRVKLIKSTSVGNKAWDSNGENTWSASSLNTYLNNEFINTFDEVIKGKIADTTWKVGGFSSCNYPAKTVYENEINSSPSVIKKIGLMYASDYGFAAAQSAWTTKLYYYNYNGEAIKSANWMYLGSAEWTISRVAENSYGAFYVYASGYVTGNIGSNVASVRGVRPVFYLTSSVNYVSGSGTAADPILVN